MRRTRVAPSVGFPPIGDAAARVLVLGSLPGVKSLQMQEYYAQPHNAFWRIMGELFGAGPELEYAARLARLRAHGIAVWDVLAAGEREGSLDSAIVPSSIVVNDFNAFFERHRRVRLICFNGNTAAGLFRRKVLPGLAAEWAAIERHSLPSTSPAHASMRFPQKLAAWAAVLGSLPPVATRAREGA
jgi:hypoxanthine-DNA glycosylase